jgi:hypothetical protein
MQQQQQNYNEWLLAGDITLLASSQKEAQLR